MNSNSLKKTGFTTVELLIVIAILAILTVSTFVAIQPIERIRAAQETRAKVALANIATALKQYNVASQGEYPDELEGIPTEIYPYIGNISQLTEGPWEGSYYDYDNYEGMDCVDDEASNSVQISIRNVPYHNPDGSNDWTLYFAIEGKGAPNCTGASWNLGECVNCGN